MPALQKLIFIAGLLHFAILSACALTPVVLDWRFNLQGLHPFLRRLFWVYGAFIALTIAGFGVVSVSQAGPLSAGSPLARTACGFIAAFWLARLGVQIFVFDVRPLALGRWLMLGYHGLTVVFTYFAVVYCIAALCPALLW